MKKTVKVIANSNEANLTNAMEFLMLEAKRIGNKKLYSIFSGALQLAKSQDSLEIVHGLNFENNEAALNAYNFAKLYFSADIEARREFLKIIEETEQDESLKGFLLDRVKIS